jgi:4-diphosphocytidyl-2-C-methyl-D-erythritol kinase
MPEVSGLAPAKINLVLEVGALRDDGFHEVSTILQALDLCDEVSLSLGGTGVRLDVDGPFAAGTPSDGSNLCARAVAAFASAARQPLPGVVIRLTKHIPPAAGLGGGASDAATTLRLLQDLVRRPLSDDALVDVAAALGSDVPFFLAGGVAIAAGRGERLTPLPDLPEAAVVLFVPEGTGIATASKTGGAFAALDTKTTPQVRGMALAIARRDWVEPYRSDDIYNAFELVAFDIYPGLHQLWESLEGRIGGAVRLAGAGPTLFWIGPGAEIPRVSAAGEGLACTTIVTRTAPALWRP